MRELFFNLEGLEKGDKDVNRRTCPGCGGRSYSSYSGPNWECPYCGENLGDIPDELSDAEEDLPGVYEASNSEDIQ